MLGRRAFDERDLVDALEEAWLSRRELRDILTRIEGEIDSIRGINERFRSFTTAGRAPDASGSRTH